MKIWIMRVNASQEDRPVVTFNVLAQGPDLETAVSVAVLEMESRGWSEVDVFRTGVLADDAWDKAKDYLKRAIENARTFGFAFIRYGPQDQ